MFIDDITIKVRAGNGGAGAVAFNKNLNQYGPAGGTGGGGGSVYFNGSSDLGILAAYRFKKEFAADDGENGHGQFRDGVTREDLLLPVPVGTVVHNLTTGTDREITAIGERVLVAKGGRGGRGNFHFRSSTNQRPKRFDHGTPGESFTLRLELKLIFFFFFTSAKSKVANYSFTTLEPNLGVYYELILADIPGLIEGASAGKGLGIKFLRHIERTKVIFHIISAEAMDPANDYAVVRKELGAYNKALLAKKEYIFLGKSDTVSTAELKKKIRTLQKLKSPVRAFSIHDYASIEAIKKILNTLAKEKYKA